MMTPDEMIAVIQAYREGKEIQLRWRSYNGTSWITIEPHPNWHFDEADYRVKPEPRTVWLIPSDVAYLERKHRHSGPFVEFREVL